MKRTPRLTEADVTPESIFNMKRRQVLKTLGLSAAAMGMPGVAQADILSWFKGNDRPPAPAGRPAGLYQTSAISGRSDLNACG